MRGLSARHGFTLVELIVAMVVLSLGIMGAVATSLLAVQRLREANAREAAVRVAGALLDSLTQQDSPTTGTSTTGPYTSTWRVGATAGGSAATLEVTIRYRDGTRGRELRFVTTHVPPVPALGGAR